MELEKTGVPPKANVAFPLKATNFAPADGNLLHIL